MIAISKMDKLSGSAFYVGGGKQNSLSILDLLEFLETILKQKIKFKNIDWRYDGQKYFVADTKKFSQITGWLPKTCKTDGVKAVIGPPLAF
jgi:CDP-paratose 2-epimerase